MNPFKIKIEPDDKDATQKIETPTIGKLMITNGIKIFNKKRPYQIAKIQNVLNGQYFRYEKEWCRLSSSNPNYFISSNQHGAALKK